MRFNILPVIFLLATILSGCKTDDEYNKLVDEKERQVELNQQIAYTNIQLADKNRQLEQINEDLRKEMAQSSDWYSLLARQERAEERKINLIAAFNCGKRY